MAGTPKFDRIASDFVRRIPEQFKTAFTPGSGNLPDTYSLKKEVIINYVNRALQELFNQYWTALQGNYKKFITMFPELAFRTPNKVKFNGQGYYDIANPYLDFYRLINGMTEGTKKYVKQWDNHIYHLAITGEYAEYTATNENPALIQIANGLAVFPQDLNTALSGPSLKELRLLYVKYPVDPTNGNFLTQNGDHDSPYFDHWNKQIADIAYLMYLQETTQTA